MSPTPLPFDTGPLGMPAEWFWFEYALDAALRLERARKVQSAARTPDVQLVADDAAACLGPAAQRGWENFRRGA